MDLTHTLAPDERLPGTTLDEQLIRVTDGVICVALEDDDVVLLPGDSLAIRAGEPRRIWNAGDIAARLLVADSTALAAAA
jgi:quercetin dioxygenase-like cupin family protein